jgi:hypothetical protein
MTVFLDNKDRIFYKGWETTIREIAVVEKIIPAFSTKKEAEKYCKNVHWPYAEIKLIFTGLQNLWTVAQVIPKIDKTSEITRRNSIAVFPLLTFSGDKQDCIEIELHDTVNIHGYADFGEYKKRIKIEGVIL